MVAKQRKQSKTERRNAEEGLQSYYLNNAKIQSCSSVEPRRLLIFLRNIEATKTFSSKESSIVCHHLPQTSAIHPIINRTITLSVELGEEDASLNSQELSSESSSFTSPNEEPVF